MISALRPAVFACLLLAAAAGIACGDSSSNAGPPDSNKIATATLPATLPEPLLLGSGAVPPAGGSTYVIRSGDTLADVAARLGYTIEEILAANPDVNPRSLSVGQTIRLPKASSAPPPANATAGTPPPATDTPEPADTATPVPLATNTPASLGQTYTVQSGDIPETIAAKFGITTQALLAANPGINPTNLQVGQVLVIPPRPEGA